MTKKVKRKFVSIVDVPMDHNSGNHIIVAIADDGTAWRCGLDAWGVMGEWKIVNDLPMKADLDPDPIIKATTEEKNDEQ